jgi:arylsulfatase A-like enzyme
MVTDIHTIGTVWSPTRSGFMTGRYQQRTDVDRKVLANPKLEAHSLESSTSEVWQDPSILGI